MTLREKALEIARGEIGKQEIPLNSNWGPHVQKYLACVGIKFPAYWCVAFVQWCYSQACEALGIKNTLYKTAGVLDFYNWVKRTHPDWIHASAMPGDIGIMDYGNGKGHMFLVDHAHDQFVETIEGNSNDEGSRNGYEVAHRTGELSRNVAKVKAFIRIPY